MLKAVGCLLILAGGIWGWYLTVVQWRRRLKTLEQLSCDLSEMETGISLSLMPMPRLLSALAVHPQTGAFFSAVAAALQEGAGLREAWHTAAKNAFPDAIVRVLLQLRLDGDEASVRRQLSWAAEELSRQAREERARQAEREKLCTALYGCGTLFLMILLL